LQQLVILGPQRFRPILRGTLDALGIDGPVAVVTAGWQEREGEVEELRHHLRRDIVELCLYRRAERVLERDAELAAALRERQDRLRRLQELYRLRLRHALDAARELLCRAGDDAELLEQRRAAVEAVRALDRGHGLRVRRIHERFEQQWRPAERPEVRRHREELALHLAGSRALAIAGGHVAVLLNRLRLFDVPALAAGRPVVAWSAGAMALTERVVLFHDSPPQGAGNAELFDAGLEQCRRLVALPHAARRLRLDDPIRVSLFARRFGPALAVRLEEGSRLDWDGRRWSAAAGASALGHDGDVRELRAW
jgi:hypothetical protein